MAKKTTRRSKSNTVNVNFEGVDVRVLLPEGMYEATVDEVKMEENNGKPYLSWKFKTIDDDPKFDGKALYNNTSLQPQSLWVLATLLDCLGVERPDGPMDLDLEGMVGMEIMLQVEHEEYEGKSRAKVVDFMAAGEPEEGGDVEVDDDETEGDEDEGGSYTEEEILAMDAEALEEVIEENDLKVRKVKKLATMRAKVVEALQEAGLIGEDDDDEAEGDDDDDGDDDLYTESEVMAMSLAELDELVKTEELDVEKPKRTNKPVGLKKYAEAVVEALEEAELLDEEDDG